VKIYYRVQKIPRLRLCRQESRRKSCRFGIEWGTLAVSLCWWY